MVEQVVETVRPYQLTSLKMLACPKIGSRAFLLFEKSLCTLSLMRKISCNVINIVYIVTHCGLQAPNGLDNAFTFRCC